MTHVNFLEVRAFIQILFYSCSCLHKHFVHQHSWPFKRATHLIWSAFPFKHIPNFVCNLTVWFKNIFPLCKRKLCHLQIFLEWFLHHTTQRIRMVWHELGAVDVDSRVLCEIWKLNWKLLLAWLVVLALDPNIFKSDSIFLGRTFKQTIVLQYEFAFPIGSLMNSNGYVLLLTCR